MRSDTSIVDRLSKDVTELFVRSGVIPLVHEPWSFDTYPNYFVVWTKVVDLAVTTRWIQILGCSGVFWVQRRSTLLGV